jgi:RimJ/RimL family protein N-acetyltransferase
MTLHTDRLILRTVTPHDLDAVHAYMSDPEVCRFTTAGPFKKRDTVTFLEGLAAQDNGRCGYAVLERDTGEIIGHVRCQPYEPETSEVGWILRRDRWGRGYGTEAGRTIAAIAARLPGVKRVSARCRPENTASARIMEKLGMTLVKRIDDDVLMDGQPAPSLLYVIPAAHVLPKELVEASVSL